ncbi:serine protease [Apophysomyces ossiformis]|uniref:Serine protease n=1 Tax=Apophysomyces ossiformis TaxID=679940 RepID=A0A8H7EPZ6_9FUNG|nr:serine protease [Apophysomyces ossiformis]
MKFTIVTSALILTGYALAVPLDRQQQVFGVHDNLAPLYVSGDSIADSYIIMLKNNLSPQDLANHATWIKSTVERTDRPWFLDSRNGIEHVYDTPYIKGYSGRFDDAIIRLIRSSPDVAYIERDSMVYANELQRDAPWGLARVSQREKLSSGTYEYEYDKNGGEGVKVYVIDTGINVDHEDFEGRAIWGITVPKNDKNEDGNGHGSHVAGTVAGKTFGVAKKAQPVAVKVLRSNGSGTMSDVIKGVDWSIEQHEGDKAAAKQAGKKFKGSVANMSLGGPNSAALNDVVNRAVEAGIVFAVAAGNENDDACYYSPSGAERAITVGATSVIDERAFFSNYGPCVDVFAPGLNVLSVWRGSKDATRTISGTSMASPHVAGLAAYFLSIEDSETTADAIKAKILRLATKDILDKIPEDTPNLLVFNNVSGHTQSKHSPLKAILGDI